MAYELNRSIMDGKEIIFIIGAFASILGAILAMSASRRARFSKQKSEEILLGIKRENRLIKLNHIVTETKRMLSLTKELTTPYNIGNEEKQIKTKIVFDSLLDYIDGLKGTLHYIDLNNRSDVSKYLRLIESLIPRFATELDLQKKYSIGNTIHEHLGSILKRINPLIG